ncbi:MAG: inner membrane CreD family protein, partial [Nitratireductor sp.]
MTNKTAASEPNGSQNQKSGLFSGLSQSPGAKFVIIGLITVLLMIPAFLVWGLVEERANRAETVAGEIANGWGAAQTINGPYLVVPYRKSVKLKERVSNNIEEVVEREVVEHAIISPDQVSTQSSIEVEERKKSIYSVPLYHMKSKIKGEFQAPDLSRITQIGGKPDLQNAFLVMGITDTTGFRSQVLAKIGASDANVFKPGMKTLKSTNTNSRNRNYGYRKSNVQNGGIHLPLNSLEAKNGFKFEMQMAINGSKLLALIPNGKKTEFSLKSNWPHPGFKGRFLPETRTISE